MNKELLSSISHENKKEFLKRLASGNYELTELYQPKPPLDWNAQEDGLYLCKQDGRKLPASEILALPGYRYCIHIVSEASQVNGVKLPWGFHLVPCNEEEFLLSLLRDKNETPINYDPLDPKTPFCIELGNNG